MAAVRQQDLANNDLPPGYTYEQMQAVAEAFDQQARKDTSMTVRIASGGLEHLKAAAAAAGYPQYQKWVIQVLFKEAALVFGDTPEG